MGDHRAGIKGFQLHSDSERNGNDLDSDRNCDYDKDGHSDRYRHSDTDRDNRSYQPATNSDPNHHRITNSDGHLKRDADSEFGDDQLGRLEHHYKQCSNNPDWSSER